MKLEIFDVEHGACALLTCDTGSHLMIDCGHNNSTGWYPGKHLAALGVSTLEELVVTNYDEDQVSGLPDLLSRVRVERLLRNVGVNASAIRYLKSEVGMGRGIEALTGMMQRYTDYGGSQPDFPGVEIRHFNNPYPAFEDENNLSLIVFLRVAGVAFMFPGDMERAGWENLLASNLAFREVVKQVDVLIAAHHGRASGFYQELFTHYGCFPHCVVISDDYRQFETQETSDLYHAVARGVQFRGRERHVLTTRCDGTITFEFNPSGAFVF